MYFLQGWSLNTSGLRVMIRFDSITGMGVQDNTYWLRISLKKFLKHNKLPYSHTFRQAHVSMAKKKKDFWEERKKRRKLQVLLFYIYITVNFWSVYIRLQVHAHLSVHEPKSAVKQNGLKSSNGCYVVSLVVTTWHAHHQLGIPGKSLGPNHAGVKF